MISIFGSESTRTCSGVNRREFLRVGSLGIAGLSLSNQQTSRASSSTGPSVFKDKAVVLLFLQGGPPQIETFDPKPNQPENNRSCTGFVQTRLPGIQFGGTFPKLAAMADRLAIVRSFGSGDGSHNQVPVLTGNNRLKATMGALTARGLGGNVSPRTGIPHNIVVIPESIRPELKLGQPTGGFTIGDILSQYIPAGSLGSEYSAFLPAGGGALMGNLQLRMERNQFDDRRRLLSQVDGLRRQLDSVPEDLASLDTNQRQAHEVLLKSVASAFDITRESQRVIDRCDTSRLFAMEDYHRGGKNFNNLVNQSRATNLLGKQMLLARRLCEAGAGFVTVVDSCWDFHADGNNPGVPAGMSFLGPQADHAIAAFLDDVQQRGLSDKILLIVTGEMGRSTSKGGKGGGTNHWGDLTPLLIAGGGLKMGQVIGETDRPGGRAISRPYRPENLLTTVLHTLFDASEVRINPSLVPGEIGKLMNADTPPITELF